MWDTHSHLNFAAFTDDWKEVADRAIAAGVDKMMVVGTDLATSKRAVEMAQEHDALYAAVGIHPHHCKALLPNSNVKTQMLDLIHGLTDLLNEEKVLAVGEIGIDYHEYKKSKYDAVLEDKMEILLEVQRELFSQQLLLAQKVDKPVIIHSREAGGEVLDLISIFKTSSTSQIKGVFHCFEGSKKYLKSVLEAGFYVSFTGNITFIPDRAEVSTLVPLDKLLLETDCPYMSPQPFRGERNEPKNVMEVAKKHAQVRNISLDQVIQHTTYNARKLFSV